jgi:hypothetical protein
LNVGRTLLISLLDLFLMSILLVYLIRPAVHLNLSTLIVTAILIDLAAWSIPLYFLRGTSGTRASLGKALLKTLLFAAFSTIFIIVFLSPSFSGGFDVTFLLIMATQIGGYALGVVLAK